MSDATSTSRRGLLQSALGALALGAAAPLQAETPRQTEGPFFPKKSQPDTDADMTRIAGHEKAAEGAVVEIHGRVLDEAGEPVSDALVDVWQANVHGRYDHESDPNPAPLDPNFQGWAQLRTDKDGSYRVRTIAPGAYKVGENWTRPPHIHFKVARRGFHELTTQMYFSGNPLNDVDRILLAIPEAKRAEVVIDFAAVDDATRHGQFDIVLRRA